MKPTAWWGRMTPEREAQFRQMADDRGRHDYDIGHYWNAVEELLDAVDELRATLKATEKDLHEERIAIVGLEVEINWYRKFLNPPMRERVEQRPARFIEDPDAEALSKIVPAQFGKKYPEDVADPRTELCSVCHLRHPRSAMTRLSTGQYVGLSCGATFLPDTPTTEATK